MTIRFSTMVYGFQFPLGTSSICHSITCILIELLGALHQVWASVVNQIDFFDKGALTYSSEFDKIRKNLQLHDLL